MKRWRLLEKKKHQHFKAIRKVDWATKEQFKLISLWFEFYVQKR